VSEEAAAEIYGVVLSRGRGAVNAEATVARRAAIRQLRIGRPVPPEFWSRRAIPSTGQRYGEYLQHVGTGLHGWIQCTWCGHRVADGSARWKDRVEVRELPPSAAGRYRDCVPDMVLRQFCCPACATLLDTEVVLRQDPPLYDEVRRWA
jgi:N-methylhydantoinase B